MTKTRVSRNEVTMTKVTELHEVK